MTSASTDSGGRFLSGSGLQAGTYLVNVRNQLGYVDEVYDNLTCVRGCANATAGTGVAVSLGSTTAGVNFAAIRRPRGGDSDGQRDRSPLGDATVFILDVGFAVSSGAHGLPAVAAVARRRPGGRDLLRADVQPDRAPQRALRQRALLVRLPGGPRLPRSRSPSAARPPASTSGWTWAGGSPAPSATRHGHRARQRECPDTERLLLRLPPSRTPSAATPSSACLRARSTRAPPTPSVTWTSCGRTSSVPPAARITTGAPIRGDSGRHGVGDRFRPQPRRPDRRTRDGGFVRLAAGRGCESCSSTPREGRARTA